MMSASKMKGKFNKPLFFLVLLYDVFEIVCILTAEEWSVKFLSTQEPKLILYLEFCFNGNR